MQKLFFSKEKKFYRIGFKKNSFDKIYKIVGNTLKDVKRGPQDHVTRSGRGSRNFRLGLTHKAKLEQCI
jgi:hypothetical protein